VLPTNSFQRLYCRQELVAEAVTGLKMVGAMGADQVRAVDSKKKGAEGRWGGAEIGDIR